MLDYIPCIKCKDIHPNMGHCLTCIILYDCVINGHLHQMSHMCHNMSQAWFMCHRNMIHVYPVYMFACPVVVQYRLRITESMLIPFLADFKRIIWWFLEYQLVSKTVTQYLTHCMQQCLSESCESLYSFVSPTCGVNVQYALCNILLTSGLFLLFHWSTLVSNKNLL